VRTIAVASRNPVKVQAALAGFRRMFPDEQYQARQVPAPSGVSDQPASDAETLRGALNRAEGAARLDPEADYWVGLEGGIQEQDGEMVAFAWIVVRSPEATGKARTGAFALPPRVAGLVRQGMELGEADDIVFGRTNSKQEDGAIGLLTGNVIDRAALYEQAVILALVPFKNPDLYQGDGGNS
jgi:inosine/xanthosine triphosphatase